MSLPEGIHEYRKAIAFYVARSRQNDGAHICLCSIFERSMSCPNHRVIALLEQSVSLCSYD
jgi:hypothetical protein